MDEEKHKEVLFHQKIIQFATKRHYVEQTFQYDEKEKLTQFIIRNIGCEDINFQIATAIVIICSSIHVLWNNKYEKDCYVDIIAAYGAVGPHLYKRLDITKIKNIVKCIKSSCLKISTPTEPIRRLEPLGAQQCHEVSWKNVSFDDGFLYIKDPFNTSSLSLRISLPESKKTFEYIKTTFINKLPPIKVIYQNGSMRMVKDKPYLGYCVQCINRLTTNNAKAPQKVKKIPRENKQKLNISSLGILGYIKQLNSKYLNYLSEKQTPEHVIYYCKENKLAESSDSASEDEDAFIFTIYRERDLVSIVYENANPSRSTYTFIAFNRFYKEAVKEIGNFFSSNNRNKRQMLMNKEIKFNLKHVLRYYRTQHIDYFSWRKNLPI